MLDLSRVPHLEERKRLSQLMDERANIEDAHAKELEVKIASNDAEQVTLLDRINTDFRMNYSGDALVCALTDLPVFADDEVLQAHGRVILVSALPAEVGAKLAELRVGLSDGEEENEFGGDENFDDFDEEDEAA